MIWCECSDWKHKQDLYFHQPCRMLIFTPVLQLLALWRGKLGMCMSYFLSWRLLHLQPWHQKESPAEIQRKVFIVLVRNYGYWNIVQSPAVWCLWSYFAFSFCRLNRYEWFPGHGPGGETWNAPQPWPDPRCLHLTPKMMLATTSPRFWLNSHNKNSQYHLKWGFVCF